MVDEQAACPDSPYTRRCHRRPATPSDLSSGSARLSHLRHFLFIPLRSENAVKVLSNIQILKGDSWDGRSLISCPDNPCDNRVLTACVTRSGAFPCRYAIYIWERPVCNRSLGPRSARWFAFLDFPFRGSAKKNRAR